MQINLIYDASVDNAPSGFKSAMAYAAQYLDSLITNPITVNIQVGWGEIGGQPMQSGAIGEGEQDTWTVVSYSQLEGYLSANSSSSADATALAHLSTTDPTSGNGFYISSAEEKAWGLISANGTMIDGVVGFDGLAPLTFDSNNRAVPGEIDFIGLAEHELTHALGRESGLNAGWSHFTPMDLFQYSAPGVIQTTQGQPAYFSIDGGVTNLNSFDTTSDPADWGPTVKNDAFDSAAAYDVVASVTSTDITLMDVLGFNVGAGNPFGPSVTNDFETILQRAPTSTELSQYVAAEQAGSLSPAALIESLIATPEAQIDVFPVVRVYQAVYGRVPDAAGLQYWTSVYESLLNSVPKTAGSTVNQAMVDLSMPFVNPATTPEFAARYGSNPDAATYVTELYANVLGRQPDAAGQTYWTGAMTNLLQVDSALTARALMLEQFVDSSEYGTSSQPYIHGFLAASAQGTETFQGSLFQQTPDNAVPPSSSQVSLVGLPAPLVGHSHV